MRPRSFLSAVVIYGTGFGIGFPFALWLLGVVTRTPWPFTLVESLLLGVVPGLLFGLFLGYLQGPTTRTFDYGFSEDFRQRLEASLRSLHYRPHSESASRITYRIGPPYGGLLPVVADITVDRDASPVLVSGPRNYLGRLEKKLREAAT
jgi:hypothetical protein